MRRGRGCRNGIGGRLSRLFMGNAELARQQKRVFPNHLGLTCTYTRWRVPDSSTAVAGTTTPEPRVRSTRAVASISPLSRRSALGTVPRTLIVRVAGSMKSEATTTWPLNTSPGSAATRNSKLAPGPSVPTSDSRASI